MSTTNDTDEMEDLTRQEEGSRGEAPKRDTEGQGQQDSEGELREALEKEKDKFLRLFAEFENYKKRTTRERLELFKTAGQELMTALLPVLDDFDRAIRELERAGEDELLKGVVLIHNKFRDTLRAKGLEPIEARVGDAFDADLHEAVTQVPAPKKSLKGKVIDVIEKGYTLGDRVIRHPKVVVGN